MKKKNLIEYLSVDLASDGASKIENLIEFIESKKNDMFNKIQKHGVTVRQYNDMVIDGVIYDDIIPEFRIQFINKEKFRDYSYYEEMVKRAILSSRFYLI